MKYASKKYGSDFIGWQDSDTWINVERLNFFLNSIFISKLNWERSYIGLGQYIQSYNISSRFTWSGWIWTCKKNALYFTQGAITYFGKDVAKEIGNKEKLLVDMTRPMLIHYKKYSYRKCSLPSDIGIGLMVNQTTRPINVYEMSFGQMSPWPVYKRFYTKRAISVHFLGRKNINSSIDFYINKTRNVKMKNIEWKCNTCCMNTTWSCCKNK